MENEFVDILEYEGKYKINRFGEIYSTKFKKILTPSSAGKGYLKVSLGINGKINQRYIHRLVAIQFIPNPNNLPQVDHIDRNKQNNSIENLRWCDNKLNSRNQDKIRNNGNIHFSNRTNGNYYTAEYSIDYYTRITKSSYELVECQKFLEECLINYPRDLP